MLTPRSNPQWQNLVAIITAVFEHEGLVFKDVTLTDKGAG